MQWDTSSLQISSSAILSEAEGQYFCSYLRATLVNKGLLTKGPHFRLQAKLNYLMKKKFVFTLFKVLAKDPRTFYVPVPPQIKNET